MKNTLFCFILLGLITLIGCHKSHDVDTTDTVAPVLTLTTPTDNVVITNGQNVTITGKATDDKNMHEMSIKITNDANSAVLYQEAPIVHDKTSFDINSTWKTSITAATNATLTVSVSDHNSHTTTKTVKFKINL